MEYNGYNGVNVSGIEAYDNTTHGSVIYDLSKVDSIVEQPMPDPNIHNLDSRYDNATGVYYDKGDYEMQALQGKSGAWVEHMRELPAQRLKRILKNYTSSGNILTTYDLKGLDKETLKWYITYVFTKKPMAGDYDRYPVFEYTWLDDDFNNFVKIVHNIQAYSCLDYVSERTGTNRVLLRLLSDFADEFNWGFMPDMSDEEVKAAKNEFLEQLTGQMSRPLTDKEKQEIEEGYFIRY
jgi:hypothetical protein